MSAAFTHISLSLYRGKRVFACLILICFFIQWAGAQYHSQTSGNWNTNSTWSPAGIPGVGSSASINSGHNVWLTNDAFCNDLEINAGGTFQIGNFNFTLNNNFRIQGGTITMGSGKCYFRDDLIEAPGGGTFNWGTGTVIFDRAGNQSIPGPTQYYHVELGGTGTKTLTSDNVINGNFKISNNANFNGGGHTLNLKGDWTNENTVDGFDENSCTVVLNGAGTQHITGFKGFETFNNLIIENSSGVVQLFCDVVVTNLTLRNGCCIDKNGFNLTVTNFTQEAPPVAKCKPTYTAYLESDGTLTLNPLDIDNGSTVGCGSPVLSLNLSDFSCTDIGNTYNITLKVEDIFGSQATCQSSVTIDDNINPTASNPAAINVQCIGDVPAADITVVTDEADNCTANPAVAFVGDVSNGGTCPEIITRTYSVTDDCGNSITVEQTITVDDNINPTASNPAAINVQCIGDVPAADITVVTDEADNCTANPAVAFVDDVSNGGTCPEIITRTYSVTDACGNSITVEQTITVDDNISPDFTVPADFTIYKDASCNFNSAIAITGDVTDESDNCDTSLDATFTDNVVNGDCEGKEIITRTWTLTDDCGNTTIKTQTITALDTISPDFTVPADFTIYKDASCNFNSAVTITGDVADESDNCDTSLDATFADNVVDGDCEGKQIITRTWTLTDDCGNTTIKTQTITVLDTISPDFTVPADFTIYKDASCNFNSAVTITGDVADESDNCDTSLDATFTDNVVNGDCEGKQIITRTWTLTDDCGNTTIKTQTITALDTISPDFTVPADFTIYKDASCNFNSAIAITGDVTDESDNCDTSLDATFTDNVVNGDCEGKQIITRTWTLTDDCGNTTIKTQTITALDTISPDFTVPADFTIYKDASCNFNSAIAITGDVTDESDNCDTSLDATFTDNVVNGDCEGKQIITRTWTLTDDCGNTTIKTQTITALDTISPEFTVPQNDTICRDHECNFIIDPAITGDVTDEADNCSTGLDAVYTDDLSNLNGCDTAGYIIRTWTLTDKCGNSSKGDQIIWVEPTPTIILNTKTDTICTYLHPSIKTSSITQALRPVKISYESKYNAAFVEVIHKQDTFNLSPGFVLSDTIINHSSVPQEVTFIFYPYLLKSCGMSICYGIPDTATIWVAPELKIIVDTISTYIGGKNIRCAGENNGFIYLKPEGGISAFSGYTDGDLHYSWNNGWADTRDIQTITAGTYNIQINDQLMCADDSSFVLDEPAELTYFIKVVSPLTCAGNDGKLSGNIHGGTSGYSYLWTKVPDDYDLVVTPAAQDTLFSIMDGTYILSITDTNGCTQAAADTLIQQPAASALLALPYPVFGSYQIRCHGENSGSIVTINADDDLPNIQYHWEGSGVDTSFSNCEKFNYLVDLYAGRYTLTYTDVSGCTGQYIIDMNEPDSLMIQQSAVSVFPNGYNVTCYGSEDGSIQLTDITGGNELPYTYLWESLSGGTVEDPSLRNQSGLNAGIYKVKVEDVQGCFASDTFEILQPEIIATNPELSAAQSGPYQIDCYGETDGFIKLHTTGGIPGYQISWADNGSSDTERFNLAAGDYEVTVADISGCSITDIISILQPDKLTIESDDVSNYTGFGVSCHDSADGSILIKTVGGMMPYHFAWTKDGGAMALDTGFIENLVPGSYRLEITDANSCKTQYDTLITQPESLQATITGHNISCTGSVLGIAEATITGGTGSYNYLWNNGAVTPTINGLDAAKYILTATDENACQIIDSVIIVQNNEVVLNIETEKEITCNGLSDGIIRAVASDGIPPYNYQWQNGPNTDVYGGLKEGTYSVHVIDDEGCEGVLEKLFMDPDPVVADFTVSDALCNASADGSVLLNATGGNGNYLYTWNGNAVAGNTVSGISAGEYELGISDPMGCNADTVVFVGQPDALRITLDKNGIVLPFCPDWHNGTLSIIVTGGTEAYSYTWDGDYADIHDPVLVNVAEGRYRVHVVDANNCQADTTLKMKAINGNCLDIPTAISPDGNFINDNWELRYMTEDGTEIRFNEVYPEGEIRIYDRIGKIVYHCSAGCAEDWDCRDMQGRLLPVDTYYFVIRLGNGDTPLKGIVTIIR